MDLHRSVSVDEQQVVVESLGGVDVEKHVVKNRNRHPVATRELHGGHASLKSLGLPVAGVAGHQVGMSHQAGGRIASLGRMVQPGSHTGVVRVVPVAVADGVHRRIGDGAQVGDHLGRHPYWATVNYDHPRVGLGGQAVPHAGKDVEPLGDGGAGHAPAERSLEDHGPMVGPRVDPRAVVGSL